MRPALLLLCLTTPLAAAEDLGLQVPQGFEVTLYAGDDLAHDIFALTIDAQGRVVVAGEGYIKTLHDDDGNGRADRATTFADYPASGAHGMYFDGPHLVCNGDRGLRKLYDHDGDGQADQRGEDWITVARAQGHCSNGLVRGPDGWYYMVCGNSTGITSQHASWSGSPVKDPTNGAIGRVSPDGKTSEVVAHGFRNPYDLDFGGDGHLFTVDSDGERVYLLPWWAPNRVFDVAQGMRHGWVLRGWRRSWAPPESHFDNVPRLIEIGRGSPTGVAMYRHRRFPEKYRDGLFSICWTFGRVYFHHREASGDSFTGHHEVFMETTGETGFAPTDLAVGPDGDLFVSIGGRGTRGSVFRVRYQQELPPHPAGDDPLRQVLLADQPLSSWSRAKWVPLAKELGPGPFQQALLDKNFDPPAQVRAIEVLTELFDGVSAELLQTLRTRQVPPAVLARSVWSVSRHVTPQDNPQTLQRREAVLSLLSWERDPRVLRAVWEAIACWPVDFDVKLNFPGAFNHPSRYVRAAAVQAAQTTCNQQEFAPPPDQPSVAIAHEWARLPQLLATKQMRDGPFRKALNLARQPESALDAIRLMQVLLGDVTLAEGPEQVYCGYAPQQPEYISPKLFAAAGNQLAQQFPSGDAETDRELARLLAMLEANSPDLLKQVADKWTPQSTAEDDIHYLIVAARVRGWSEADIAPQVASALANLHPKLTARGVKPTDEWTPQMRELTTRLLQHDAKLAAALVADPAFGHIGHTLYAALLPPEQQQIAVRKLLATAEQLEADDLPAWTTQLVELVASLPDEERLPALRAHWNDYRLRDSIALVLANSPQPQDRQRLLQALASTQGRVTAEAARALQQLPAKPQPAEIAIVLSALKQYVSLSPETKTRQALVELLQAWTGQDFNIAESNQNDLAQLYAPWFTWFAKQHPQAAARLSGFTGNAAEWESRLAQVDWSTGDQQRGFQVFQQKNCFRCHSDARRLGPDLAGIATRLARRDLFTSIIEPSRSISPLYQPTQIITTDGRVHNGMLIYDSPELYLVQTTPDTTVRVPGPEVQLLAPSRTSFMPNGLLNDLSDQSLADLYAYLKTLTKK